MNSTLHIAMRCSDLEEASCFYRSFPNTKITRTYADRICLNFMKIQLVMHLEKLKEEEKNNQPYPFHFGINFHEKDDFDKVLKFLKQEKYDFSKNHRFKGSESEHYSLIIFDPFGNCIEFKHYLKPPKGINKYKN